MTTTSYVEDSASVLPAVKKRYGQYLSCGFIALVLFALLIFVTSSYSGHIPGWYTLVWLPLPIMGGWCLVTYLGDLSDGMTKQVIIDFKVARKTAYQYFLDNKEKIESKSTPKNQKVEIVSQLTNLLNNLNAKHYFEFSGYPVASEIFPLKTFANNIVELQKAGASLLTIVEIGTSESINTATNLLRQAFESEAENK